MWGISFVIFMIVLLMVVLRWLLLFRLMLIEIPHSIFRLLLLLMLQLLPFPTEKREMWIEIIIIFFTIFFNSLGTLSSLWRFEGRQQTIWYLKKKNFLFYESSITISLVLPSGSYFLFIPRVCGDKIGRIGSFDAPNLGIVQLRPRHPLRCSNVLCICLRSSAESDEKRFCVSNGSIRKL